MQKQQRHFGECVPENFFAVAGQRLVRDAELPGFFVVVGKRTKAFMIQSDLPRRIIRKEEYLVWVDDRLRGTLVAERPPVTGGGRPPPVPTERGVRIYRTTLFGGWSTELRAPAAPGIILLSGTTLLWTGYYSGGGLGLVIVILFILVMLGRI